MRSNISKRLLIAACLISVFIFAYVTGFECVFLKHFGIICPGCGMMRAAKALARLDFRTAFSFHPMVFTLPLIFLYAMTDGRLFGRKALDRAVLILIAAGFLINYIIKLVYFFK